MLGKRMRGVLARVFSLAAFALWAQTAAVAAPAGDADSVRTALTAQAAAWNRGDLDGFMRGYWNDPKLRFASGANVTYGWQPTLEHYRARYPDRAAMGVLRFTDLEIDVIGSDAAQVFGRWSLTREQDAPHGVFTLLLRRGEDGWKIVSDHTSAAN